MTAPQHTDALLALIQERVNATNGELIALLDRVKQRLAQLALDPAKLQGPALATLVDQILVEISAAGRRAVTGAGSDRDAVGEVVRTQRAKVSALSSSLTRSTRPTLAKALLIVAAAHTAASGLKAVISDQAVARQTDERRREARRRGGQVAMWVPERDACARCLRYAGVRLLRPGDLFPGGLSFDPDQRDTAKDPISGPPLHPHCRCEIQLVPKGDSEGASEALRREAERAIAKGWALPSEGSASRRRAAKALLADGTTLPVSVQREAAKRLREGERFTRGVPTGNENAKERAFLKSYSGVYR